MDVGIDSACRHDELFARNHFGRGTDHKRRMHRGHNVGIAGFPDAGNESVLDSNVGLSLMSVAWKHSAGKTYLINSRPIDYQCIGDDEIESFRCFPIGGLTHALADGFA